MLAPLNVALYLFGIEVLENIWAWLEILIELIEELNVVLHGLGPLLLDRGGQAAEDVLHLGIGEWVHGRYKASELFN